MNAHVAKDGMGFAIPEQSRTRAARATPAAGRRSGVAAGIGAAVQWLAGFPRRRAVMEALGSLTDHELADIGLNRGDLPRVFDPGFAASRSATRRAGC